MGYFPNGTSGMSYEAQYCDNCAHYGPENGPGCPIWGLHLAYNYDQGEEDEHGEVVKHVLDSFIPRTKDGIGNEKCRMFVADKTDRKTLPLFPGAGADGA